MSGTIYDLIPHEEEKQSKPPRYMSKFRQPVKEEYFTHKGDYKTMGQAKVPAPTTDNFLKKHSKEPKLPDKTEFKYPDDDRKRPMVPAKDDKPLMGLKTTKNFITTNAVQTITSVPKKPEKVYVDTIKGDKNLLVPSGLEPVYIHKKEYGTTPQYLTRRQEEMKRAQEEYNAYVAEHFRRGAMQQLTNEERQSILDGLKRNWEEIHDQYQGLSVVTDTAPKKNRKERMEAEMKQLERDIESIERHKVIYIA
ncbi:enkurin-like [Mercenaria mercenaria]|uniref:enkurin-like n=1 Tax=Mercenaria mercenaria TaxID=6596 RepID=UPI00234E72B2|nr:enkurin-like [Mercenaria mercenaria]